jgi:hypothetical protein
MLSRGIRPLFVLVSAPCWAQRRPGKCRRDPKRGNPTPNHYDDYADFAAAAAARYPRAVGFEIWNEPNWRRFWGGRPDAGDYAALLKRAAAAIHRARPSARVVSGGLSPHGSDRGRDAIGYSRFVAQLYERAAIKGVVDAIGVHPYPSVRFGEGPVDAMRAKMGNIWQVMRRHGDADRPMWVTETGISTAGNQDYSQAQQAATLVDLYNTFRRIRNVPVVVVHRFMDDPGGPRQEPGFGVLTTRGHPKKAYCALAARRGVHPC